MPSATAPKSTLYAPLASAARKEAIFSASYGGPFCANAVARLKLCGAAGLSVFSRFGAASAAPDARRPGASLAGPNVTESTIFLFLSIWAVRKPTAGMKAETAIAAQSLALNFYKYFGGEKYFPPAFRRTGAPYSANLRSLGAKSLQNPSNC
jgi:hypothetical protein